jgi:hypothetical protein
LSLRVSVLSRDGVVSESFELEPIDGPSRTPRVRITEVLARPASSSAQEFVEVINEESYEVSLAGWLIATPGGMSELPDVMIPAQRRALIVGSSYDPRGAPSVGDPPPAPGTPLIRLRTSIASRGLVDRGADVWLATSEGQIVSRMPGGSGRLPPRSGVSVVRADQQMREEDPHAWAYDALNGSTPGAPDRFR